jgi:hypothetical protein
MKIIDKAFLTRTYSRQDSARYPFDYYAKFACRNGGEVDVPITMGVLAALTNTGSDCDISITIEIVPNKESLKVKRSDLIKQLAEIDVVLGVT